VPSDDLHLGHTLGDPQRGLERIGETSFDAVLLDESIDDDLDGVLLVTAVSVSSWGSPSMIARANPCEARSASSVS
jgi:hypothetical protein